MKANRLAEIGFKEWHSLQGISASDLIGLGETIFIVGLKDPRSKSVSEIWYIGRAKRPMRKVLGGLVAGYGGKETLRIHKKLMAKEAMGRVQISWKTSRDSKGEQRRLLSEYRDEHGDLPLWNQKGKLKPAKTKTAKTKTAKTKTAKTKTAPKKVAVATQSGEAIAR